MRAPLTMRGSEQPADSDAPDRLGSARPKRNTARQHETGAVEVVHDTECQAALPIIGRAARAHEGASVVRHNGTAKRYRRGDTARQAAAGSVHLSDRGRIARCIDA